MPEPIAAVLAGKGASSLYDLVKRKFGGEREGDRSVGGRAGRGGGLRRGRRAERAVGERGADRCGVRRRAACIVGGRCRSGNGWTTTVWPTGSPRRSVDRLCTLVTSRAA